MKHCSINQILNAKSAGDIFSADPNIMKTEYRNYAKVYHPDVCHREDVMTTVNTLFAQAKRCLRIRIGNRQMCYSSLTLH